MLIVAVGVVGSAATPSAAADLSGQRMFGNATVEPAYDDGTGNMIFLLTPNGAPFPSKANQTATAPLYLPAYPTTSTIDPATLNCQPTNCGHVNVLPFPAPGYVNGGAACQNWGFPTGACSLIAGHDHLVGIARSGGDFNIAWKVHLVIFTEQGFADGAINEHLTTLDDLFGPNGAVTKGDALDIPTAVVFNCSAVSEAVYLKGTPLSF